ncbi:hypothetical protein JKG47_07535 [Acidithiobacillus sp. MC6.1]|nr:hypothetical protein [Acidithiobacillus sp. MC6.1]
MAILSAGPDIDSQKYDSAEFLAQYTQLDGLDEVIRHIVHVTFRHYLSEEVLGELQAHPEFAAHMNLHEQKIRTTYVEIISALSKRVGINYRGQYFNGVIPHIPDVVLRLASNDLEDAASALGGAFTSWELHDFDLDYRSQLSPLVSMVTLDTMRTWASRERYLYDKKCLGELVQADPMGNTNASYYRRLTCNHSLFMSILINAYDFSFEFGMKSGAPSKLPFSDVCADLLLLAAYGVFDYEDMLSIYDKDGTDAKMQRRCSDAAYARAREAYSAYSGLHSFYSSQWTPGFRKLLPEKEENA